MPSSPSKRVIIRETAYSTYAAVLIWLSCRYIGFASLRSKSGQAHIADLQHFRKDYPNLPAPVSPKSEFRLAHLLELTELQAEALRDVAGQLTSDNVAKELFSDVACSYKGAPECRTRRGRTPVAGSAIHSRLERGRTSRRR